MGLEAAGSGMAAGNSALDPLGAGLGPDQVDMGKVGKGKGRGRKRQLEQAAAGPAGGQPAAKGGAQTVLLHSLSVVM
jgi:hypothetical protein